LRVRAAFLAERDRAAFDRLVDARPPLREAVFFRFLPRPDPPFFLSPPLS
jgi:hypothetical protein